jgi:integrase
LAQHLEAAKNALKKRTWEGHEETARVHLVPMLGHLKLSFHDLRHACATLHFSKGVHPKVVQELLGHATINITLDTYSHVLPGMGGAAASAMDDALD